MANDVPHLSPLLTGFLGLVIARQASLGEVLLQAQRNQYQMLTAWAKSLGALNQDLWDRWVCRFGGGAPLDG